MPSAGRAWLGEGGGDSAAVGLKRLATLMGEKKGTTSIRRKSRKKEGGIKGPQARGGGSSGSPPTPLLFKPPKKARGRVGEKGRQAKQQKAEAAGIW